MINMPRYDSNVITQDDLKRENLEKPVRMRYWVAIPCKRTECDGVFYVKKSRVYVTQRRYCCEQCQLIAHDEQVKKSKQKARRRKKHG